MAKSIPENRRQRFIILGPLLIISLLALWGWMGLEEGSLSLAGFAWQEFVVDSDILGRALQELFVPMIALYLFSTTSLFEEIVTTSSLQKAQRLKLSLILIGILIVSLMVTVYFTEDNDGFMTSGMLVILVAGLLGGWRTGLVVGVATIILFGAYSLLLEPLPDFLSSEEGLFSQLEDFVWIFLDPLFIAMLGGGILVGILRDTLGMRVWKSSFLLFVTGFLATWFPAWMTFFASRDVEIVIKQLAVALIIGFVLMVFGLLGRQAQGRAAEKQLAMAEQAQMQAELKALRAQINPHFLFNALSTIRYHARNNPTVAYELLDDLADVFHSALNSDAFVSLGDELQLVESYLAIEQARLGERLAIIWQIDEEVDVEQPVPALILQPLVENAVIHGIAPLPDGGAITITAVQDTRQIEIQIVDDGVGFSMGDPQVTGSGIGLVNVRERMVSIYGSEFTPLIESREGHGTQVILRIPR